MSITLASKHVPDPIAAQLDSNGYDLLQVGAIHSPGARTRAWAVAGWSPTLNNDGSPRCMTFRNLVTLELRYESARHLDKFSKVAQRLADALVKSLTPTGALIRRTPTVLQVVYRVESLDFPGLLPPLKHGIVTRDERSVLALQLTNGDLPVNDGAEWVGGRSPLAVARAELPEWNAEETSRTVHELVNRLVATGGLHVCSGYQSEVRRA